MRAGTSSLSSWLAAHPEVYVTPGKEVWFFDHDPYWERGLSWYESLFAGAGAAEAVAVGEASPSYMFRRRAVERMASTLPDAKLVAMLRNPVDRAYSHWHYNRLAGTERASFEDAIARRMRHGRESPYLARGRYRRQLDDLLAHYPAEQVKAVVLDDMAQDPRGTYADICRFIGVDPDVVPDNVGRPQNGIEEARAAWLRYQRRPWRHVPRRFRPRLTNTIVERLRPPPMAPEVRARLIESFADDNRRLGELLGRDVAALWETDGR